MSRAPNGLLSIDQPAMHSEHVRILPVDHPPKARDIGVCAGLRGHVHTM